MRRRRREDLRHRSRAASRGVQPGGFSRGECLEPSTQLRPPPSSSPQVGSSPTGPRALTRSLPALLRSLPVPGRPAPAAAAPFVSRTGLSRSHGPPPPHRGGTRPAPSPETRAAPRPRRARLRSRPAPPAPLPWLAAASSRILASPRWCLPPSDAGLSWPPHLGSAGSPGPRPSFPPPPRDCPCSPKDANLSGRRRSLRWILGRSTESRCVTGPGAGPAFQLRLSPPSPGFPVTPSRPHSASQSLFGPQRPPSCCNHVPAPARADSPSVQGGALLSLGEPGTGTPEKANGSEGAAPFREHRFAWQRWENWSRDP